MTQPTYPTTAPFSALVIQLNPTGVTPPVWSSPVGFDTKSQTLTAATSEANIPPSNNPDMPGWTVRGVSAKSLQIQGAGVLAHEDSAMWEAFYDSGAPMQARVYITGDPGYRMGLMVLTNLGSSVALAQNGKLIQRSITLDSAGPMDYVTGVPS